jgi:hypothetical protein
MHKSASKIARHLAAVHDGKNFIQTRLALPNVDPTGLGALSLGYNHGKLKVYWTKEVGQEGVIDWDLDAFLSKVRECVTSCSITGDMAELLQKVSNQLMPGFAFDVAPLSTHVFLRPHTEGKRAGFALCVSRSFDLNALPGIADTHVFENIASKAPVAALLNRSIGESTPVGDIHASMLWMVKANGALYTEISIEFLFNFPFADGAESSARSLVGDKKNNEARDKAMAERDDARDGEMARGGSSSSAASKILSPVSMTLLAGTLAVAGLARYAPKFTARL